MVFTVFIVLELQAQSPAAAKLKSGNGDDDDVVFAITLEAAYPNCFPSTIIPDKREINIMAMGR
jgi:hypothetical protein